MLTLIRHGQPSNYNQADFQNVNVRRFLTAYMIANFPANVFAPMMGPVETSLVDAANRLINAFESIMNSFTVQRAFGKVPRVSTVH